jgi:hypothetical protein
MTWLEGLGPVKWIVGALLVGLGLMRGAALGRSIVAIRCSGFRVFLRHALSMETETWKLIGILALLAAMAAAMVIGRTPLMN